MHKQTRDPHCRWRHIEHPYRVTGMELRCAATSQGGEGQGCGWLLAFTLLAGTITEARAELVPGTAVRAGHR